MGAKGSSEQAACSAGLLCPACFLLLFLFLLCRRGARSSVWEACVAKQRAAALRSPMKGWHERVEAEASQRLLCAVKQTHVARC